VIVRVRASCHDLLQPGYVVFPPLKRPSNQGKLRVACLSQLDLFAMKLKTELKLSKRLPAFNPDLIVLGPCNLQAAPILRQMLPSVPIILFTLYARSVLERQAREAGTSIPFAHNTTHGTLAVPQGSSIRSRFHSPDSQRINSNCTNQRSRHRGLGQTRPGWEFHQLMG